MSSLVIPLRPEWLSAARMDVSERMRHGADRLNLATGGAPNPVGLCEEAISDYEAAFSLGAS